MVEGNVGHRAPCGFQRGLDHFQDVARLRAGIAHMQHRAALAERQCARHVDDIIRPGAG